MESRAWVRTVLAVAFGVALAALICVVVYRIRMVFVPFAAGFVVAYIFDPLLDRLEARGWSRSRAVWTVMLALLSVLALALVLLVPRVVAEVEDAWTNRDLYGLRAQGAYERGRESVEHTLQQYLPQSDVSAYLDRQVDAGTEWLDRNKGGILRWLGDRGLRAVSHAGGMLVLVVLGTLIAFHFMLVIDPLRAGIQALLDPESSREVDAVVVKVNHMLGAYVRGLVAVSVVVGIATAAALMVVGLVFGTRYALLIGLLAGLTYAIPWIGQTVSALTALFFGFVTADHHGLVAGLVAGALVVAINQVSDNVVMPRIVGKQVGLHPLAILFAIMAGFQLFGLVGLVIAVPVAAGIRIMLQRWVPILPEDEEEKTRALPALDPVQLAGQARDSIMRLFAAAHGAPQSRSSKDGSEKREENTDA